MPWCRACGRRQPRPIQQQENAPSVSVRSRSTRGAVLFAHNQLARLLPRTKTSRMRVTRFSLAGVLLYACFVAAQNSPGIPSPSVADAGALDGSTYTNRLLDFSFALPTGWEPRQDLAHELRDGSFVLLVADRENETPYRDRLLIIADIAARYPSLSLSGYVHKLAESWHTQGSEILHQGLDEDVGSQHFYRVDYADPSGPAVLYKTFIATQRRGFFLSWTFVVQRKEQLTELVQSLHHSVVFRGENTPITGVISSHPVQPPRPFETNKSSRF